MSLHNLASSAISTINPMVVVTLKQSTGSIQNADYTETPTYNTLTGSVQIQGMSESAIRHMNELNIGGVLHSVYLDGEWASIVRADQKGGDLMIFGGHTWMVVHVLEQWPSWCKVVVQQQIDPAVPA